MQFLLLFILFLPSVAAASDIILDIGHSPQSSGAVSCSGRSEFDFNKTLAKSIHVHLQNHTIQVALTSDESMNPTFDERISRSKGHKVLLSIHHDSVQPQFVAIHSKTAGVCSNYATGFSIFISAKNRAYKESLAYAKSLGRALVAKGYKPSLHHAENIKGEARKLLSPEYGVYEFADLKILKGATIPAVLLEASVIVNTIDEKRAATPEFHQHVSESIYEMLRPLFQD